MLHRLWAPLDVPRRRRRGGWRQQLQTIETELEAEPARVSRLAAGLLLEWGRWCLVGGEVATTLLSCPRGRSGTSCGTAFGGCGHCSERSQWVDEIIGDDIQPLITRVDSDKMTHMVLPSTWIRLLRAYSVQFSSRLVANIQNTGAFWSQFFARETHQRMGGQALLLEGQNRGRSRPRCSADRLH